MIKKKDNETQCPKCKGRNTWDLYEINEKERFFYKSKDPNNKYKYFKEDFNFKEYKE